jgi:hypothetical protein
VTALAVAMARAFQSVAEEDKEAAVSGYQRGPVQVDPRIAFAVLKIRCHMLSHAPTLSPRRRVSVRRFGIE